MREFEGKGKAEVVNVGGRTIGRGTFEPGWRWSNNVKPIAGTDSCEVAQIGLRRLRSDGRLVVTVPDTVEASADELALALATA